MSEQVHNITDLPSDVPVSTVIKHYARKATKLAVIGCAVVGGYVLVQRARAAASEDGELTLTD